MALILALVSTPILAKADSELSKGFSQFRVPAPSKDVFRLHENVHQFHCTHKTSLFVFQLKVEGLEARTAELLKILHAHGAKKARRGCQYSVTWRAGIGFNDSAIQVSRSLSRYRLMEFSKDILKIGRAEFVDEIAGIGADYSAASVEYEKLKSKIDTDPEFSADRILMHRAKKRLKSLAPKAEAFKETHENVIVHIHLIDPSVLSGHVKTDFWWYKKNLRQEAFERVEELLASEDVEDRRNAVLSFYPFVTDRRYLKQPLGGPGLIMQDRTRVTITDMVSGMSAERAKVPIGWIPESVEGVPIGNKGQGAVQKMLRGPIGSHVEMTVKEPTGDTRKKFRLLRDRYIPSRSDLIRVVEKMTRDVDPMVRVRGLDALQLIDMKHEIVAQKMIQVAPALLAHSNPRIRSLAMRTVWFSWQTSVGFESPKRHPPRPFSELRLLSRNIHSKRTINLCLGTPFRAQCKDSGNIVLGTAGNSRLTIRLTATIPDAFPPLSSQEERAELCQQLTWDLEGACKWKNNRQFYRTALGPKVIENTRFQFLNNTKGIMGIVIDVKAGLTEHPQKVVIRDMYVGPGQTAIGDIVVPRIH